MKMNLADFFMSRKRMFCMSKVRSSLWSGRFSVLGTIIGISLVLVFQGAARGEGEKKEKLILSLQQLIDMAIAESPEIRVSQSETAAASTDLEQAQAAYYPQIEVTALVGPVNDADRPEVYNGRIHDPSPDGTFSNIGIFGRLDFTATQPLYTFGKLANRKEAASQGIRVKELEIPKKKSEIVLRVKQLYYALVLARQGVSVADESNDFFEDARKRISRLLDLGSPNVEESDLYMVDAYHADSDRFRAEAEKGKNVAYVALKYLINLPPEKDFDIPTKDLPMIEETMGGQEAFIKKAFSKRPEFKQLEAALEAQKSQVKAAQSDRYPSFFAALEGSLAGAPGREKFDNPYISDEFNHSYVGVVAGLKWFFDFGILKARVDKAQAEYSKLLYTKSLAERNIPIEVAKSYQEVLQWKKTVAACEKAARASRKWVIVAFSNFDMGIGKAKNMFDAIEKYGHNRGNYLEALYNYNVSLAQLEYAIGTTAE